ncbi:MAG: flagellar motor protein MotA [Halochromatium sp.]|nr:flagellar motor protein MotA [Halochromatium sp.]
MSFMNYIVALFFFGLFLVSFLFTSGVALFFNLVAFVIVISGTLSATFISYPVSDIRAAFIVALNSYRRKPPAEYEIIDLLLEIAVRSRRHDILALEKVEEQITVSFLRSALGMLVDGYKAEELQDVLATEMHYFRQRRAQQTKLFRYMAQLAPAFGIIGTVIGLIGMLSGIGDPDVILRTIPVALTSTLYGLMLGNFLFTPIAENISAKTAKEFMLQTLISEGVMAINQNQHNTIKLTRKLESFLTPSRRSHPSQSLQEIRDRYQALRSQDNDLNQDEVQPKSPAGAEPNEAQSSV